MPPLRRRYLVLSGLLTLVGVFALTTTALWAEGTIGMAAGESPIFAVLSLLSLPNLAVLLVQWGATRERLKDITSLEDRIDGRFNRVERQIDALFRALQADRRVQGSQRFGERVEDDEPT